MIDQFESDVQIFLLFILIASSYLLFCSISSVYFRIFISSGEAKYLLFSIYFLSPPFLGIFMYVILPWLYRWGLHLDDTPVPDSVRRIGTQLHLDTLPRVKSSSLNISPLVYGRGGKNAVLVLPDMSLLTEEEQDAVITHELSHIKQGDVGFFTWLTLLAKGFTYWILPFPLVVYFGYMYSYVLHLETVGFAVIVPLFFVSSILLKNSLSRTRESIADAYVIFHGLEISLKRALIKYAALKTSQKGIASHLYFYHRTKLKSVLATHVPLQKRLSFIEKKTFLSPESTNLSSELAVWTGVAAAFVFHSGYRTLINISVAFDLPLFSDTALYIFWFILFLAGANAVAASYVFPITKASSLFLDLGRKFFIIPLVRNLILTVTAASLISYGLSFDTGYMWRVITAVLGGFLFWILGFAGARRSDFSHGEEYLVLAPVLWSIVFWYPLQKVYSLSAPYQLIDFGLSVLSILVLALVLILILMEKGQLLMNREERILMMGRKRKWEFPQMSSLAFVFLVLLMLLVPALISFVVCVVSCLFDRLQIVPVKNILMYGVIAILGGYGLKKSDILFFLKIAFLVDIIPDKENIERRDIHFIHHVIKKYQSRDGGFDYAGVGFSNQKDTYYCVKTAKTLKIPLNKKVVQWICTTENEKGGYALFAGGYPRIKGLYYAAKSLSLLDQIPVDIHVQWICASYKEGYFHFENDTDSLLLQTCYAVELLDLCGALHTVDTECRKWIESHFSENLNVKEAFFATRAMKILNSDAKWTQRWLDKNEKVSSTRVDKNVEEVYYYVKMLQELNMEVPALIGEQAVHELTTTRRAYEKRFKEV